MEIKYGLNVSSGHRADSDYSAGNFYAPKGRTSGRNYRVGLNKFISTINDVFTAGGNYSDVAKQLGVSNSAVYSRVRKLRETIPSLPAVDSKSDIANEAIAILNKLGVQQ